MPSFSRTARLGVVAAALAGVFALPSAASAAPCTEVRDTAGSAYNVRLCGVSDVDQFRSGLHADGAAFCGPASLYNTLHYMRTVIGAPISQKSLGPIPDPVTGSHASATSWLWYLGVWAGQNGSSGADNRNAFNMSLFDAQDKGWTFSSYGVDSNAVPEFGYEIAKAQRNAPVQIWYGRYTQNASGWVRNGGHIVTVVGVSGTIGSGQVQLQITDPSRTSEAEQNLETQSAPLVHTVTLKKRILTYGVFGSDSYKKYTRYELSGPTWGPGAMVEGFNAFKATKP